ncbi:spore germination protein [Proteiniborus sp. MB09-C3]|uniref:spore germination protein n=1 Tax=Proteiniborus sp. MB09-C3 TaxID=3050072 RepID=UPI00255718A1|nr:spore germination protein [Proteiniborus sp. MB09-C3]WIV12994.1 spore germination protein [Proteiniborus sp. MB09-C3]
MEKLTGSLARDLDAFKKIFFYPKNKDFIIRPVHIKAFDVEGVIIYINGTACINTLTNDIIKPLTEERIIDKTGDITADIIKKITTMKNASKISIIQDATKDMVKGNSILLVEGCLEGISIDTSEFEHRPIDKPEIENVLKGPKESFIESALVNRSLVRKHLKYENLITETIEVGEKGKSDIYMMYVEGIVDPDLLENVRTRIENIRTDFVLSISILEQFIEERSYSLISTVLYTERPDRAAAFLNEGYIVLIMDGASACLVVPVTFWSFFHTAEDQYLRWSYGNFTRFVRLIAIFISMLTPSMYIALTNYHVEMIPSDLAVSIAAARTMIPFPVIVEVLFMEISFELIREAGVRAPATLGNTIGIVGALILGQAAVAANIVSPILVIIVSITGLSSFAVPDISLNFTIRILRFALLIVGGFMGFLGIALLLTVFLIYGISITSFGVPYLSPLAPHYPSSGDTYTRPLTKKQWLRPFNISTLDTIRRKPNGKE